MKRIAFAILALFVAVSAFSQDTEPTDPRVKSVETRMALSMKQVELDAKHAREVAVKAYKVECAARIKVLTAAIDQCEKKVKAAAEVSDKKSKEALTLKIEDLKVELEAWKGNLNKDWTVRFEDATSVEDPKEVAKPGVAKNEVPAWLVGKWKLSNGDTLTIKESGVVEHTADKRTAVVTGNGSTVGIVWDKTTLVKVENTGGKTAKFDTNTATKIK